MTATDDEGTLLRSDPQTRRSPRRRHLPSLGAFATFEIAAKHRSFTLAASELHVTQAAISQQIRGLEKALDCQLFIRKHQMMELTPEGATLLEAVGRGLDTLSDAIFRIGQRTDRKVITIASTHAAISCYVKPLTDAYRLLRPDIRFTLLASDQNDRVQDFDEVDLAMICGNERSQIGPDLIRLFPEIVDPVAAPDYLAAHGPLESPMQLPQAELMELHPMHWSSDAISWYPLRWDDWFRHHGLHVDELTFRFVTNSYSTLVDAAVAGEGIILGWRHLVHRQVADGRLLRIFDMPLDAGRSYYLKLNPGARDSRNTVDFIDYFQAEAARMADPTVS